MPKILLLICALVISNFSFAQSRDTTFNHTGRLSFNVDGNDTAEKFFLQDDNKILITGQSAGVHPIYGTKRTFVARYLPNGNVDSTYAINGLKQILYGSHTYYLGSILLNSQKTIVCTWKGFNPKIVDLTKLNEDGTADETFGENGVLQIFEDEAFYTYLSVGFLEYNNKLLVTLNYQQVSSGPIQTNLYSFNYDGTLDTSFGENGVTELNFGYNQHYLNSLNVFNDSLYLNGFVDYFEEGTNILDKKFILAKLDINGSPDTTFGLGGYILNDIVAYSDLEIQPDGKMISIGSIGGNIQGTTGDIAIIRFNVDGEMDSSFSEDGFDIHSIDQYQDFANESVLRENGDIVIGGSFFNFVGGSDTDGMLVSYSEDGNLDTSFGTDGLYKLGSSTGTDRITQLILTGDTIYTLSSALFSGTGFDVMVHKVILDPVGGTSTNLSGTIDSFTGCEGAPITVKFYEPGSDNLVNTYATTLTAEGAFILSEIETGVFDIFIKPDGYLQKGFGNVTILAGENNLEIGNISGADINNNNSVNIFDISIFVGSFGSTVGDTNYSSGSDLDCSGIINITDISIINLFFGQSGDEPPLD